MSVHTTRLVAVASVFISSCMTPSTETSSTMFIWPSFGPDHDGLTVSGHTNVLPDFIGPIDGSAKLTVMTEGNHFPVLLPLVFNEFPEWCAQRDECAVRAEEILLITLPQYMVVHALSSGSVKLGNAVLPLINAPGRVFPDVVMGGPRPLSKLASAGLISKRARVFARHRGLGLLLTHRADRELTSLSALAESDARIILATPSEAGARSQYVKTLDALLGKDARESILEREVSFPTRLKIQHRDVPYALLSGAADVGILFGHLSQFYAECYPETLVGRSIPEAEPFGQEIAMARSVRTSQEGREFESFLLEAAPHAYPRGGFSSVDSFGFGRWLDLD